MIIIPASIIPACLLGSVFAGIGLFNGLGVSVLIFQHKFHAISLAGIPFLIFAVWFIAHICRRGDGGSAVSRATNISRWLLIGILSVCLLVGLATGGMIWTLTP